MFRLHLKLNAGQQANVVVEAVEAVHLPDRPVTRVQPSGHAGLPPGVQRARLVGTASKQSLGDQD